MSDKKINIEKLLDELENIVKKMEDDNLNLEQSLESYEKGIGLVKQAQSTLNEIEKKVKILSKKDGFKDFDTDD